MDNDKRPSLLLSRTYTLYNIHAICENDSMHYSNGIDIIILYLTANLERIIALSILIL